MESIFLSIIQFVNMLRIDSILHVCQIAFPMVLNYFIHTVAWLFVCISQSFIRIPKGLFPIARAYKLCINTLQRKIFK